MQSPPPTTLLDVDAVWRYGDTDADFSSIWLGPTFNPDDPDGNPGTSDAWKTGQGLFANTPATLPEPILTTLPLGPTTYYFRSEFEFTGSPTGNQYLSDHLIDGRYGDSFSWRPHPNDPNPFVAVNFGSTIDIGSVAWGRDNGRTDPPVTIEAALLKAVRLTMAVRWPVRIIPLANLSSWTGTSARRVSDMSVCRKMIRGRFKHPLGWPGSSEAARPLFSGRIAQIGRKCQMVVIVITKIANRNGCSTRSH